MMSEPFAKALGTGLCAVIASGDGRVAETDVDGLADAYEGLRGARPRARAAVRGRVAVVAFGPPGDEPPLVSSRTGSWAVGSGRAYVDGALVDARLEDLDGAFALVRYDATNDTVVVASDPFGMQPLYVAERPGRTYVSTSVLALAKHLGAPPSRLGFLTFLRAGYQFGEATAWAGIERLEPATSMTLGARGVTRRTYWRAEVDGSVRGMSLAQAADHCIEVATETLGRYLGHDELLWSDLSGGYDTRLLTALLDRAGVPFSTNTRGEATSQETGIARAVAREGGWGLTELSLPAEWPELLPGLLGTSLAWTDGGLEALEHSWVLWAHQHLSGRSRRLLYGGGGEHYRSFAWRQEFLSAGRSTVVQMDNWLDLRMLHPMDTTLFASDPTSEVRESFRRRLERCKAPYSEQPNTTQLDAMYAYKVTGHFGQYRAADSAYLEAELPFYFKPVFTAAFSTDYRVRNAYRLQRRMLARLNPRVAAVETQAGGPAEPLRPSNAHRFVPYYLRTGHRALNKVGQMALGRRLLPPVERYDWWCPEESRRAAMKAVRNGGARPLVDQLRTAPLFQRERLAAFFALARGGDFAEPSMLGRILTAELALRAVGASIEEAV
jgi:hypothetical protein